MLDWYPKFCLVVPKIAKYVVAVDIGLVSFAPTELNFLVSLLVLVHWFWSCTTMNHGTITCLSLLSSAIIYFTCLSILLSAIIYFSSLPPGVTFDEPVGKTDGSVTDKQTKKKKYYFNASPGYASFVRGKNVEVGDFPELDIFDDDSDDEDEL